jgi:hypothetical protein
MADETAPGGELPAEVQSDEHVKTFFLNLALRGKDAWNAWRRNPANKEVRVTFAGSDFSETPRDRIDFSGFEFGDYADFSGCKWRGAKWEESEKNDKAFKLGRASFARTVFGSDASFDGAAFGHSAIFDSAAFGDDTSFDDVAFDNGTSFDDAAFGSRCSFNGVAFGWSARFANTVFKGCGDFTGKTNGQPNSDGAGPDRFLTISFANARFDDEAVFASHLFDADADFTNVHFCYPPDFDGVSNADRIDFTGAYIGFVPSSKRVHWTNNSRIPVRLRAVRRIAEDTDNHDLARDLYIEERKAQRGVYQHQLFEDLRKQPWKNSLRNAARLASHNIWIAVMGVYWALSDYGRSFVRPFLWLIVSGFIFYWCYSKLLEPVMERAPDVDQYKQALRMLALGNAVPFVGPPHYRQPDQKITILPLLRS